MLVLLLINFVTGLVFYTKFDPGNLKESGEDAEANAIEQEKLVSYTLYVHTGLESLFNIAVLAYLIA